MNKYHVLWADVYPVGQLLWVYVVQCNGEECFCSVIVCFSFVKINSRQLKIIPIESKEESLIVHNKNRYLHYFTFYLTLVLNVNKKV